MRKLLSLGFIVLALGLTASRSNAQALTEILRRMDAHNVALQSLKTDITRVDFDAGLNDPSTRKGNVTYLAKTKKEVMRIRIDWEEPDDSITINEDDVEMLSRHTNVLYTGKASQAKGKEGSGNTLAFLSMSKSQMKANYDVSYLGEESLGGGVRAWHLLLMPKTRMDYKNAEIWVDSDGMLRQAKTVRQNNDSTTVYLANLKKNVSLKRAVFQLDRPKGVAVKNF